MTIITCSVFLLVILGEIYCKTTAMVNETSSSWGYDYSLSHTNEYKVKKDNNGYQFKPLYNNTSSSLKKHYNSQSIYDKFTSPGTNISQSHARDYVINSTSNGYTDSSSNDAVPNKVNIQTDAPIIPSPSQGIVSDDTNGYPSFPANGPLYRPTFGTIYYSRNTPMYGAPTGPLYYPQTTTYGQMYGPTGGSIYGIPNGQMYSSPPQLPTVPIYADGPQNRQMYEPQNVQTYYPIGPSYGSYRSY